MNRQERKIFFKDIVNYKFFVYSTIILIILESLAIFFKTQKFIILNIVDKFDKCLTYIYGNLDANTLFTTQVMVATLMLSVVSIIAGNINERCLNISYKLIFFKPFIYKNNYLTIAFKMMISIFMSLIEFVLGLKIMLF